MGSSSFTASALNKPSSSSSSSSSLCFHTATPRPALTGAFSGDTVGVPPKRVFSGDADASSGTARATMLRHSSFCSMSAAPACVVHRMCVHLSCTAGSANMHVHTPPIPIHTHPNCTHVANTDTYVHHRYRHVRTQAHTYTHTHVDTHTHNHRPHPSPTHRQQQRLLLPRPRLQAQEMK